MSRSNYATEHKTKIVLQLLQGEKDINTLATENNLNPNQIRNWKKELLANASNAFQGNKQAKDARKKEAELEKTQNQMLKTIGQLTLERDFLQGCFCKNGVPPRTASRLIIKSPFEDSANCPI